jgi:hypothetical protein
VSYRLEATLRMVLFYVLACAAVWFLLLSGGAE